MKIKLDENIPSVVVTVLRSRGLDTDTVLEESLGGHDGLGSQGGLHQRSAAAVPRGAGVGGHRNLPTGGQRNRRTGERSTW